jgi:hypothetical protein
MSINPKVFIDINRTLKMAHWFFRKLLISSHPESLFPDENTQLPDISMTGTLFKKGFRREHDAVPKWGPLLKVDKVDRPGIQVFPSENLHFRMETN